MWFGNKKNWNMRHDIRTIIMIIIMQRKCSVDMISMVLAQAHPK